MSVNSFRDSVADKDQFLGWQDFEEYALKIVRSFDVTGTDFRKVFSNGSRKFEIDVVAYFSGFCVCIDCKLYGAFRYRISALKSEARKHSYRCSEFGKINGLQCLPVIVSFYDDNITMVDDVFVVPHTKMNQFMCDIHSYITYDDDIFPALYNSADNASDD